MVADHPLPAEWRREPDGRYCRDTARLILLDAEDRLLLVRGHDATHPEQTWWFTIGGGIDPGEDAPAAAVRELTEEAGLSIDADRLVGPVLTRTTEFTFFDEPVRQHEKFYLARLEQTAPAPSSAGWTDIERRFVDELRWWPLAELAVTTQTVFPPDLAKLAAVLAAGWDGTVSDGGLVDEDLR